VAAVNTIAKPAAEATCVTNSAGSRLMMANATAPPETSTPIKFQMPDQTTATTGGRLLV
jgi:hypothetical protein